MKNIIFTVFFTCFAMAILAQIQHRCAYDHAVHYKDQLHPGYKERADQIFRLAKQYAEVNIRTGSTYIIPLVFHVVWKDTIENLPECKILEQVDVLNKAYQRLNSDTVNLRSIFSGVAANPDIQFRLDSIIWKQTNSDFFSGGILPDISFSDRVKHDTSGGSDAINTLGHLNVWVCNLGSSGILGYAYPPAGLSNWPANSQAPTPGDDGVVLDYRIVGAEGVYVQQSTTINTKGNAAIHEVGHYLGLRHVWGDGLLSILGFPDCNADDGVNDTPNCGVPSNYQCDTTQNTCGAGTANDLPDMIENFMDYSEEVCQNTFTAEQVAIMQAVLNVERNTLLTTGPIHNSQRPSNDALNNAISLIVNPDNSCTFSLNSNNTSASPSMPSCSGTNPSNDVWYSFQAISSDVNITLSNVQTTAGSSSSLNYEIFSGSCGALNSLGCFTNLTNTLGGLQAGETYYLRVYSTDISSSQSFDICLQAAGLLSVEPFLPSNNDVKVYPNPSNGHFSVELSKPLNSPIYFSIKDMLGRQISIDMQLDANTENFSLNLSDLNNGFYIFEFKFFDKTVSKKVIIKK